MLESVTPLILTFNESSNIRRTLEKLSWAKTIVVVDSYSTDGTLDILNEFPQVQVFHRRFDTHANQWNYGLQKVNSEWVLSLDADYVVTDELIEEIKEISPTSTNAYFVKFRYCIFGKPLQGTLLPPRQALFRRTKAFYKDDGHTQLLQIEGQSEMLSSYIYHDDRKPLSRWLWAQDRYMILEAKKLLETPTTDLNQGDRLRKQTILAPFAILFYCLILRKGILDGWIGWYYALQRMLAEIILTIHLIEFKSRQL